MRFLVDNKKVAFRREDIFCEMVNPHHCDIIARNKHADKHLQPKEWEWIRCKARGRAVFPHSDYDLCFECGATDPRGITVINLYGDDIGTKVIDDNFISSQIRRGQEHRHFGGKKSSVRSIAGFENLSKKKE